MIADIHSHILPVVDDGVDDSNTSVEMLRIAESGGTAHIIATPHYIPGSMEIVYSTVDMKCRELQELARAAGLTINIYPGAEIFISPEIPELIEKGIIHTMNGSSYILIELPMDILPIYTNEVLFSLQLKGLTPIIAHPERNAEIRRDPGLLDSLISRGILAQANSGSITGLYGREARQAALKLIRMGLIQFIGSDAHSMGRNSPDLGKVEAAIRQKFGKETARKLFYENGMAVIENRTVAVDKKF